MKRISLSLFVAIVVPLALGSVVRSSHACYHGEEARSDCKSSPLLGKWRYEHSDYSASETIDLVLRSDCTYTKTLDARVQGSHYGGTHDGTWTAEGTTVHLSGDGNWPPYSHDLSKFQKR